MIWTGAGMIVAYLLWRLNHWQGRAFWRALWLVTAGILMGASWL